METLIRLAALLVCSVPFCYAAAVAALLQLPLVTSNAGVAEAACWAVLKLAMDSTNSVKLGAAGACEGGYPT